MSVRRLVKAGLQATLVIAIAGGVDAATATGDPGELAYSPWEMRRDADLTSSAVPGPGAAQVADEAYHAVRVTGFPFKADATANAPVTCDGCSGDSATLQIVYVRGGSRGTVDNVATAWSRCTDCRATALSVQVAIVQGSPVVEANNRALSLNAACERCNTASAAYQLVVASPREPRMSPAEERAVRAWVAEQAAALRAEASAQAPPDQMAARTDAAMRDLTQLVNDALGTRTLERRAQLRSP